MAISVRKVAAVACPSRHRRMTSFITATKSIQSLASGRALPSSYVSPRNTVPPTRLVERGSAFYCYLTGGGRSAEAVGTSDINGRQPISVEGTKSKRCAASFSVGSRQAPITESISGRQNFHSLSQSLFAQCSHLNSLSCRSAAPSSRQNSLKALLLKLISTAAKTERSASNFLSMGGFVAAAAIGLYWHSRCEERSLGQNPSSASATLSDNAHDVVMNFLFGARLVGQKLQDALHLPLSSSVARCEECSASSYSEAGGANYGSSHDFHPMWRSEENRPFERKMEDAILFCGNSNQFLAAEVAYRLSTKLGEVSVKRFADGEVSIQFLDSLRGKDVYIIQPTSPPVNEHLMELLLMVSTCRRASAKKITAVIPYYGYARQDRKLSSRVPISAADVARMLEAMGVDRVVAVDLHCGQIQGFFGPRVPVDNLEAQIIGLEYIQSKNLQKPVIVSPDAGGVYRARKFQEGLLARGHHDCGLAMLIKQRACANEIERMDLVGHVHGSDVIIVDDMIDTAGTLCEAARELRKHGARRIFAFATHGLFSGPSILRIEKSPLEEVIVTNTIKSSPEASRCPRISTLSMSILLADAIRRIHQKESLNDLFSVKA